MERPRQLTILRNGEIEITLTLRRAQLCKIQRRLRLIFRTRLDVKQDVQDQLPAVLRSVRQMVGVCGTGLRRQDDFVLSERITVVRGGLAGLSGVDAPVVVGGGVDFVADGCLDAAVGRFGREWGFDAAALDLIADACVRCW